MSNKEQCPKCKSYQICTERRLNGKKWCTSCNHVLVVGAPLSNIVKNSASIALEKLYKPNDPDLNFMGMKITEDLSSRALMAVIQELARMSEYEKMFKTCGSEDNE